MQSTTPLTQYDLLLGTFSSQLTRRELVNVKKSLEGHVAKEKVQQIRYGKELFDILRNCGLISETKFAFLKKIFKDSGLDRHLLLLDEYLERNRMKKERKIKHTGKDDFTLITYIVSMKARS